MENECVFCNIVAGRTPAAILYQDEMVIAIRDINPQTPTHVLVMPKEHIPSLVELGDEERDLASRLIFTAKEIARSDGVDEMGYRIVINCREHGGQAVPHLHLHLLGGQQLSVGMG